VNLREYTTLELAYLYFEILRVINKRQTAVPKLLDELNQKTYELTHEIELEPVETVEEILERYQKLELHFQNRRLAKSESIVVEDVLKDVQANRILSTLGQKIKNKQIYFKLEDGDQVIELENWNKFYGEYLEPYM
jgi:allophanate hydrolase subunit 1